MNNDSLLSKLRPLWILVIISIIAYYLPDSDTQTSNDDRVVRVTPMQLEPLYLNKDTYTYYEFPDDTYQPLIDRIDGKDLLCIVNGQEITWKFGEEPFKGMSSKRIGIKLPNNYHKGNDKIFITCRKQQQS